MTILISLYLKEAKIIPTDILFTPRPIYGGWFSSASTPANTSARKFHFDFLYWKGEFQQIIQEIPQELDKFQDPNCILRRELLECLIRSCNKIGNLEDAAKYSDIMLSLQIVDLGTRILIAEIYLKANRLEDALWQAAFYIKERPSVYHVWLLVVNICLTIGDAEAAKISSEKASFIASRLQITLPDSISYCSTADKASRIPQNIYNLLFPNHADLSVTDNGSVLDL